MHPVPCGGTRGYVVIVAAPVSSNQVSLPPRCHDRGVGMLHAVELCGASAIVTGGASGLGAAAARALVDVGMRVVLVDRDAAAGRVMASAVGATFVEADVRDERAIGDAVALASLRGPLRLALCCAGMIVAGRTVDRSGRPLPLTAFERTVEVNLVGTFNAVRLAAAEMAATKALDDGARGVIITTASVSAFEGRIGQAAYAAAKAGVVGMTLPLARDLAAVGVRVNTIAPGAFDTPILGLGSDRARFGELALHPRRLGKPGEFASMVLAVARNDYVNGEVVRLDGGSRVAAR